VTVLAAAKLKPNRLNLPDGPLRPGLSEAFVRIVAYALAQVSRCAERPEKAIHEFRKSVRRARALVKLLRPLIGERAYAELNDECRQAVRATSAVRDADVLIERVAAAERTDATRVALDRLVEVLAAEQAEHRSGGAAEALEVGAVRLRPLPARLALALPAAVSLAELRDAFARGYRRARRTRRACRREKTHASIHTWRKRVKELRYQLEMLVPHAGPSAPVGARHQAAADLAEELGHATDDIALVVVIEAHRDRLEPASTAALLDGLEARIAAGRKAAVAGSRELFALKPPGFAREAVAVLA